MVWPAPPYTGGVPWQDLPSHLTPVNAADLNTEENAEAAYAAQVGQSVVDYFEGQPDNRTRLFFAALRPYNVKADGKTVTDAAITSGQAALSSTSAVFSSLPTSSSLTGDVGKLVVVIGAGAAGAHLYTTIASVSGGVATLAANAGTTVSGAEAFYATNDTTGWQNCINDAAAVNGTIVGPEGSSGINAALTTSVAMTIEGQGVKDIYGASPNASFFPSLAPYLKGSVLVQCAASTDILQSTVNGAAFHLKRIGLRFAGRYLNTGHGINSAPASGWGNIGGNWEDVHVFGHDGNHDGFLVTAACNMRLVGLRSYGGGGLRLFNGTAPQQPGNITEIDCFYNTYVGGSAHAYHFDGSGAGANWSAIDHHNVNPQVNVPSPALAGVAVPTNAQQVIQTTNGGTMNSITFDPCPAQSQVSGSNCTFPYGIGCYRANAPSNAATSNSLPTTAPSSGTGVQNQFGMALWAEFVFQMFPSATGIGATTLNGVHATGATTINVVSAAGFSVGQVIQIGDNTHDVTNGSGVLDYGIITAISTNAISILTPGNFGISFNHSSGATVQAGASIVYAQTSNTNTWPGGTRPDYIATPIGTATGYQRLRFYVPAGYWLRLDYGNAIRAWGVYSPNAIG